MTDLTSAPTVVCDTTGGPTLIDDLLGLGADAVVQDMLGLEFDASTPTRRAALAAVEFTPLPEIGDELPVELRPELALAQELARESLALATRLSYRSGWRQFARWCQSYGLDPLPASAPIVAAYLSVLAVAFDNNGDVLRDDEGRPVRGRVPSTVANRLNAINKAHLIKRLPPPGDDPQVAAVLAGIRRTFGVRPEHRRAAIDLDRLRALLAAVDEESAEVLRRNVVRLLATRLGMTAGQIARLGWANVQLSATDLTLDLPPTRAGQTPVRVHVSVHRNPALCLVSALSRLHAIRPHNREVVINGRGDALTRQGLHKALTKLAESLPGWKPGTACALREREMARLTIPEPAATTRQLRDRAILTTGWTCAFRRTNIVGLSWRDMTPDTDEWEVIQRRSKTDQAGEHPHTHWLPLAGPDTPCPATAMTAWHRHVTALLGADPRVACPDTPVFPPIDRHGNLRRTATGRPARLSGEAVNELVQKLAYRANLGDAPAPVPGQRVYHLWGAHGLRAGFITEGLRDGKLTIEEVQEVTGHKCIEVLLGYRREVNARAHNPARKLFARMSDPPKAGLAS